MSGPRAPLYRGAMEEAARAFQPKGGAWGGNAGLWYDKFCDRWSADFSALDGEEAKRDWVESVVRRRGRDGRPDPAAPPLKVGDAFLLAEHADRRRALVEAQGGAVLTMRLDSRFATGLGRRHPVENGFAWHHTLGVPFLAGAGVKGLTRAWAEQEAADVTAKGVARAFGPRPREALHFGSIVLLDGLPVEPVQLVAEVMTPHTGPWNLTAPEDAATAEPPADWHSPNPIVFLAVEAGAAFQFAVLPRAAAGDAGRADAAAAAGWLRDALAWLGAGAKTSVGFGRFGEAGAALKDPESPFAVAGAAPRGRITPTAAAAQRGFVDREPVEILKREGSRVVVRFVKTGDIETVGAGEVVF